MYAFKIVATAIALITSGALAIICPKLETRSSRDVTLWLIGTYTMMAVAVWT